MVRAAVPTIVLAAVLTVVPAVILAMMPGHDAARSARSGSCQWQPVFTGFPLMLTTTTRQVNPQFTNL
ncbi:uncharacterized membrane protein YhaH (DUF805 family) [Paenibacillus sp. V4I3]|nr:uncharacterized membrane protein YhaH (DUF805 family) [Paenibacillus sp. V4I3]